MYSFLFLVFSFTFLLVRRK